jgi:hypothetical protein
MIPRESHALTQDRKLIDRLWYKFFADFYARFDRREQRPVVGQMYMHNNVTATVITNTTTFVKIAGTSTAGTLNEYTHTSGRLTNAATYRRRFKVSITGTLIAHQNDYIEFGIYDSTAGAVQVDSRMKMYIHHGTDPILFSTDAIMNHGIGDYIEVHLRDTTSVHNVTVERLNVVVTEI